MAWEVTAGAKDGASFKITYDDVDDKQEAIKKFRTEYTKLIGPKLMKKIIIHQVREVHEKQETSPGNA